MLSMTNKNKKSKSTDLQETITNGPISFDEAQKAKEEIKKIESELPKSLKDSWSKNYFRGPQLSDKNQNTIWLPDIGLTKDGDFKDFPSGWRLFLRSLDPDDFRSYQRTFANQNRGGFGWSSKNNDESQKYNGLVLYLTKTNGDSDWNYLDPEDNNKQKVMELPLSHLNVIRHSKIGTIDNWLGKANFIPYLEYNKAVIADNHSSYAQILYLANEILRGWTNLDYYKHTKKFHAKYFASLSEDIEKERTAFQRKRAASLAKIAKLNLLLEAYNKGCSLEEATANKKAARADRIAENAGVRLGVEFERFTQLAVEVSRLKMVIEELEREMAKPVDKCKLDFSYFNRKIDKIETGRGFLKEFLPTDKK